MENQATLHQDPALYNANKAAREIAELLVFVDKLKEVPVVPENFKDETFWSTWERQEGGLPYGRSTWNVISDDLKNLLEQLPDGSQRHALMRTATEVVMSKSKNAAQTVINHIDILLAQHTMQIPRLMEWFVQHSKVCFKPGQQRKSADALSSVSAVSTALITGTSKLPADKIHYNMFNNDELKVQNFRRFLFPLDVVDSSTKQGLLPMAEVYSNFREFMYQAKHTALEDLTQKFFEVFLEHFLTQKFPAYSTRSVTSMSPVEQTMPVSKKYLQDQDINYAGGDIDVVLSLKSDAVISPKEGMPKVPNPSGVALQNLFVNCSINVKMKRFRFLHRSINNSPMTQLCAESMIRLAALKKEGVVREVLYSILHDMEGLYVLCHTPTNNEYWISRKVTDCTEIVHILNWLMSHVIHGTSAEELCEWLTKNVCNEADQKLREGSSSSITASRSTRGDSQGVPPSFDRQGRDAEEATTKTVTFEELMPDEDAMQDPWEHFYAFQAQRQFGINVKPTEDLILHHDILSEYSPWPTTTQYPRACSDMEVEPQPDCWSVDETIADSPVSDLSSLSLYQSLGDCVYD